MLTPMLLSTESVPLTWAIVRPLGTLLFRSLKVEAPVHLSIPSLDFRLCLYFVREATGNFQAGKLDQKSFCLEVQCSGNERISCFADGLGFCANSLELGCDCVGNIQYFDATMNDSKGKPLLSLQIQQSSIILKPWGHRFSGIMKAKPEACHCLLSLRHQSICLMLLTALFASLECNFESNARQKYSNTIHPKAGNFEHERLPY